LARIIKSGRKANQNTAPPKNISFTVPVGSFVGIKGGRKSKAKPQLFAGGMCKKSGLLFFRLNNAFEVSKKGAMDVGFPRSLTSCRPLIIRVTLTAQFVSFTGLSQCAL
jgi:hypothetical protein